MIPDLVLLLGHSIAAMIRSCRICQVGQVVELLLVVHLDFFSYDASLIRGLMDIITIVGLRCELCVVQGLQSFLARDAHLLRRLSIGKRGRGCGRTACIEQIVAIW